MKTFKIDLGNTKEMKISKIIAANTDTVRRSPLSVKDINDLLKEIDPREIKEAINKYHETLKTEKITAPRSYAYNLSEFSVEDQKRLEVKEKYKLTT